MQTDEVRNLTTKVGSTSAPPQHPRTDATRVMPSEWEGSQTDGVDASSRLSVMDSKALRRLDALMKKNVNPCWVNDDLYRLMFIPEMYVIAYEKIKSKPGNMTKGADGSTIDGFSMASIEEIISKMRDESFQFQRARRVYIPKKSGGKRPLGVGNATDKVVQAVVKTILEAIYDSPAGPTFREHSHGFRPGRSPHTALQEIKKTWHGATWIIEGDIKGCFDNIDHDVLIEILKKRIHDDRFINLIRKALTAGYLEFNVPVNAVVGTPQGSVLSPILANIYMHELDVFVEAKREQNEVRGKKKISTEYKKLTERIYKLRKLLSATTNEEHRSVITKSIQAEVAARACVPVSKEDGSFVTVKYVRYADDWIVGINGPKALASKLKAEIGEFLANTLRLTLSVEKTHIRHAKSEEAFFLGTRVKIGNDSAWRVKYVKGITREEGTKFARRTTGWHPWLAAPIQKIVQRLAEKGFCYPDGRPRRMHRMTVLDDDQIVAMYKSVMLGYSNYYSFVDNRYRMHRIAYIMRYSCASTLASKHRITLSQAFARYGYDLRVKVETKSGTFYRSLDIPDTFRRTNKFMVGDSGQRGADWNLQFWWKLRSRSKLGLNCVICGNDQQVEMHHIRHVRKTGSQLVGFHRLMAVVNRKQIPVCTDCHDKIHSREYDGLRLSEMHDPESFRR